jgi:polyribonucleotide nucleotidyltransferase
MNKIVKKETDFAGKKLVLETGELAVRANLAVKATFGETVVLVTVVAGEAAPDQDFFPLTVNYEEKMYASGTIKSSRFVKRDGRSTDDAVIAQRAIDHAIRPLFPNDYMDEVQVVATVLSLDPESDPEFLSMVAVSAALHASDIPWVGPMSTARVGLMKNEFVLCPCVETVNKEGDLNMMVSFVGKEKKFLAVEAGGNIIPEAKIIEAMNFARENVDPIISLIEDFAKEVNPEGSKYEYESKALGEEVVKAVTEIAQPKVDEILRKSLEKNEAKELTEQLVNEICTQLEGKFKKVDMIRAFDEVEKNAIRKLTLTEGKRLDGRKIKEVRPISSKVGVLPRTHGSALFVRGTTQALTVATLGSPSFELLIQDMYGERNKRFIHYYNFPPYSTGETGKMGGPRGREIGHGMIAEKALRPVIPDQKKFPYMILLVSEILSSNGSSSMASTCGSTLALMDAGVPIKDMVGGVAMGLIVEDETFGKYSILTDLSGEEDKGGYLDFKMTGTKDGVTAIQCDMKVKGIPMKVIEEVIAQSREGRLFILEEMQKVINTPHAAVSQYAPKMLVLQIPVEKIGVVIGSGGKTIKEIQEQTESEVFIEDDGTVVVSSDTMEKAKKAHDIIYALTKNLEIGEVYEGTVKDLLDFGALVEILPGRVGLLHVSEIAHTYVNSVKDWFKPGDKVKVKIVGLGDEGKISLSKKALEARPANSVNTKN